MLITTTKCLSSLISRAGSSALQILVQPPTTPWQCRYCRRGPAHARADGPRGARLLCLVLWLWLKLGDVHFPFVNKSDEHLVALHSGLRVFKLQIQG